MEIKRNIKKGVYLVVDPSMDANLLLDKLKAALQQVIVAVQIWDNFLPDINYDHLIKNITSVCHQHNVPVLINNKWQWINDTDLDGVHFDEIPNNIISIRKHINKPIITGITCNNDLSTITWANMNQMNYVSFCSMFPSATSTSCLLVSFDTVVAARQLTSLPIFLAGGINPETISKLQQLPFDGIAVISGIMNAEKPNEAAQQYLNQLNFL